MKKIAMFGGSFNPIHNGHLKLALSFALEHNMDKVLFIPTNIPPHKQYREEVTPWQRWEMCVLAAAGHPKLGVSDLEISRQGASYTVDTLCQLQNRYPDDELYLITGADMFLTVQNWKRAEEIFQLAVICAVPREEDGFRALKAQAKRLKQRYHARTELLDLPLMKISSTEIRNRIKMGQSIEEWVPKSVEHYIKRNRLYQDRRDQPDGDEQ